MSRNFILIRLFNSSFIDKIYFIEAAFYTLWAYLMIHVFSFKKYLHWIKNKPNSVTDNEKIVPRVQLTIKRVIRYSFWPTTCYTQAIAARLLLRRRNIKSDIFLGLIKNEQKELTAHAWTKVNGKIITGDLPRLNEYKKLYTFE